MTARYVEWLSHGTPVPAGAVELPHDGIPDHHAHYGRLIEWRDLDAMRAFPRRGQIVGVAA